MHFFVFVLFLFHQFPKVLTERVPGERDRQTATERDRDRDSENLALFWIPLQTNFASSMSYSISPFADNI